MLGMIWCGLALQGLITRVIWSSAACLDPRKMSAKTGQLHRRAKAMECLSNKQFCDVCGKNKTQQQ